MNAPADWAALLRPLALKNPEETPPQPRPWIRLRPQPLRPAGKKL
jgi:hypothetical protein